MESTLGKPISQPNELILIWCFLMEENKDEKDSDPSRLSRDRLRPCRVWAVLEFVFD